MRRRATNATIDSEINMWIIEDDIEKVIEWQPFLFMNFLERLEEIAFVRWLDEEGWMDHSVS